MNRLYTHTPAAITPKKSGDPMYHQLLEWADRDIIRIYNPLDEIFRYKWDSMVRRVQPHEYQDVYRFLAMKFLQDITEHELNAAFSLAGEKEVQARKAKGIEYIDPQEENRHIWDNLRNKHFSKPARDRKMLEMAEKCIIGVVRFYNEQQDTDETIVDENNVPVNEAIQERMNRPVSEEVRQDLPPLVRENKSLTSKKDLAREATV